jgi:hypothetical protein
LEEEVEHVRRITRWSTLAVSMMALVAVGIPAQADHATRPHTKNMHAKGHSPQTGSFLFPDGSPGRTVNSDIAFWGNLAFNGNYDGFRIVDISDPDDPQLISWTHCNGDQGDIVVWEDVLVRSWNAAKATPRDCDGQTVPAGFEGVHIFDISNLEDPELVGEVELSARPGADAFGCGSHTATAVPDLENDRLIVYNQTSGGPCPFVGILEVPLDDPGSASFLRNEPLEEADAPHDSGVILGDVNMLAVASHDHANIFSIGAPGGGSFEDPEFLYTITEPGVCNEPGNPACNGNWHSASFSWDGEVIILGWEPGGGAAPECEASDPPVKKSAFFYDADNGAKLGQWTLPRPQTAAENCTIHNYNVVPNRNDRNVLVVGNYQAGTWVVEFSDPANPVTLGWSDPPPLVPTQLGGAWSSYWYNNFIYESEITKGLNVFRFSGKETGGAMRLDHLNPQTQEFSL